MIKESKLQIILICSLNARGGKSVCLAHGYGEGGCFKLNIHTRHLKFIFKDIL